MRFIELTESVRLPHIRATIERECQPFINRVGDIGKYPMFRGMDEDGTQKQQGLTRHKVYLDDRVPLSSAQVKHDRYNAYFEEMYGEPFRNAVFASGSQDQAASYGSVYVIFPIGEFSWLWSPIIGDMAIDIRWPSSGGFINIPPSQEVVDDVLSRSQYTVDSDLKGAINSHNEIMIRCPEYYAVSTRIFTGIY